MRADRTLKQITVSGKLATGGSDNGHLALKLSSSVPSTLRKGAAIPRAEAASGAGTLVYVDMSSIFEGAQPPPARIWADGWDATWDQQGQTLWLCLAPASDITLISNDVVTVDVHGVVATNVPTDPESNLWIDLFRVDGITFTPRLPFRVEFMLAWLRPSGSVGDIQSAMRIDFDPIDVNVSHEQGSQIENRVDLVFYGTRRNDAIIAGANTEFTLTLRQASDTNPDGIGALCSQAQFNAIKITGTGWDVDDSYLGHKNPYWVFRPKPGNNLFDDENPARRFTIEGLVTTMAPGPTLALITARNVPGFKDDSFFRLLLKLPHVELSDFRPVKAEQTTVPYDAKGQEVQLQWKVANYETLIFEPGPNGGPVTISGKDERSQTIVVNVKETTPYRLTAYGKGSRANFDSRPCTITMLPKPLDSVAFTGAVSDLGVLTLEWRVRGGPHDVHVYLGDEDTDLRNGSRVISPKPDEPLMSRYLLTVLGPDDRTPAAPTITLRRTWQRVLPSIKTGGAPAALAFAPDGSTLFVVNGANRTLFAIEVVGRTVKQASISHGADHLALAPGGTLYVGAAGPRPAISEIDAGTLAVRSTVPLPGAAALTGIAASRAGVFASFKDNTGWWKLGKLAPGASVFQIAPIMADWQASARVGLADADKVYATSGLPLQMHVFAATDLTLLPSPTVEGPLQPQGMQVDFKPGQIATSRQGHIIRSYSALTRRRQGTDFGPPPSCEEKVFDSSASKSWSSKSPMASLPPGIALSPEGDQLFVAPSSAMKVIVLDMTGQSWQPLPPQIPFGGDVEPVFAVSPLGTCLFVSNGTDGVIPVPATYST